MEGDPAVLPRSPGPRRKRDCMVVALQSITSTGPPAPTPPRQTDATPAPPGPGPGDPHRGWARTSCRACGWGWRRAAEGQNKLIAVWKAVTYAPPPRRRVGEWGAPAAMPAGPGARGHGGGQRRPRREPGALPSGRCHGEELGAWVPRRGPLVPGAGRRGGSAGIPAPPGPRVPRLRHPGTERGLRRRRRVEGAELSAEGAGTSRSDSAARR